jgi:secreted trypsin-like serine protease
MIISIIKLVSVVIAKDTRIIGGVDADIRDMPYVAQFRFYKEERYFCAGAIIGHYHILTAAHCTDDVDQSDVRVYVGTSSSSNYSMPYYNVHSIKIHPQYLLATDQSTRTRYDIAVVIVSY